MLCTQATHTGCWTGSTQHSNLILRVTETMAHKTDNLIPCTDFKPHSLECLHFLNFCTSHAYAVQKHTKKSNKVIFVVLKLPLQYKCSMLWVLLPPPLKSKNKTPSIPILQLPDFQQITHEIFLSFYCTPAMLQELFCLITKAVVHCRASRGFFCYRLRRWMEWTN